MFPCFQKFPIEAEGDFIPVDVIVIKRHDMCRSLVLGPSSLPMVKEPAGINTIGPPSKPCLAPIDGTSGPTFECCGSAAPRQMTPIITLIPVHRIVCCTRMALSIASQCIQHRGQTQWSEQTEEGACIAEWG